MLLGLLPNDIYTALKIALATLSFCLLHLVGHSQVRGIVSHLLRSTTDTIASLQSQHLDSVVVSSPKTVTSRQLVSETLLKANPAMNLSELLQKQSGIFIRGGGAGSLSTLSYKGLGSMHTPLVLNGANMQSSMNGSLDLSLLGAAHFSQLSIDTEVQPTLGIVNAGSAIVLENSGATPQLSATVGGSTLGEKNTYLNYANRLNRINYAISVVALSSPNRVALDRYGFLDSQLTNTDFKRWSVMQTFDYRINSRLVWRNTVYVQTAGRGIPPALGQVGEARQTDRHVMTVNALRWKIGARWLLNLDNQLWQEEIGFEDVQRRIITHSSVFNTNTTLNGTGYFKKGYSLSLAVAYNRANYTSEALKENATWNRWLPQMSASKTIRNGKVAYHQTAIYYENKWVTNASLHLHRALAKEYSVVASAHKVFRLPVLNELYWYQPGEARGRADLQPEQGYRADVTLKYENEKFKISINPHIATYTNWVQWSGFPEIRPENIAHVNVVGAVWDASYTATLYNVKLVAQVNVHGVSATYKYAREDSRNGKQLIFTPSITQNSTITIITKNFSLYINQQYVGYNFTASDNREYLSPYILLETGGFYTLKKWRIGAVAANLANTTYYTQPRTPLPGQQLKINLNYTIPLKS